MTEVDLDATLPNTQGSTQPCSESVPFGSSSQNDTQSQSQQYWGRLCPLSRRLRYHDLTERTVTLGTSVSNTIVINEEQVEEYFKYIDKVHFRIERGSVLIKGSNNFRPKIDIHDLSCHGLFVNGLKVGCKSRTNLTPTKTGSSRKKKEKKIELKNNDLISLPTNRHGTYDGNFDAYVFIDNYAPAPIHFPRKVSYSYHVSRKLGAGAFGEVYLVSNKISGKNSAMKAILQSLPNSSHAQKQRDKLFNELEILKTLDHPNVIKLNDVILHKNECFVLLEFMEGNDLAERITRIGRLSEQKSKLLFFQICMGVKYLHTNRIIHRDIKPANILLASRRNETLAKLTDFGLSKILKSSENMKTLCGTKMYAAPELLSCKNEGKYTSQVDIWSLGVLLFVCLSGDEPFATEPHLIEKHIMKALYVMTPDVWKNVSILAKNLVDSMLIINPIERIRLEGILEDDWLKCDSLRVKLKSLYSEFGCQLPEDLASDPPLKKYKT